MKKMKNNNAYTLVEALMATALTLIMLIMVYNFYNTTKNVYFFGMSRQALQDGSNIVLGRIIEGKTEPTGVYRLAEAVSYNIANLSELHFFGTDNIERWYKLNGTSTAIIYHHPTSSGTIDETIYTVPSGAVLTLRFWVPAVANYPAAVIGIDAALTQNVFGKMVSGSSTTIVNLRNHP